MIAARIGHDHFLVWSLAPQIASGLVPDLRPWIVDGRAFLLCAGAEFLAWRWRGLPGMRPLRVAGWLVPCALDGGTIGNAFVRRFIDHPLIPWPHARIRIDGDGFELRGAVSEKAGGSVDERAADHVSGRRAPGAPAVDLRWFSDDRCGVVRSSRGWHRWPIAKKDWGWRASNARLQAPWAERLGAHAVGMITVTRTVARWDRPAALAPLPAPRPGCELAPPASST